jgi:hypothetical protein
MDIPKTLLATCRAEYERQMEMEKAATPGPWEPSALAPAQEKYILHGADTYIAAFAEWDYEGNLETDMDEKRVNIPLICLSRNLNPARLATAVRLIDVAYGAFKYGGEWNPSDQMHLELAAALLGVEVVE